MSDTRRMLAEMVDPLFAELGPAATIERDGHYTSATRTNPSVFRIGRYLLTQDPEFEVQGPLTGCEAEVVAIRERDEVFISVGSDQCDREKFLCCWIFGFAISTNHFHISILRFLNFDSLLLRFNHPGIHRVRNVRNVFEIEHSATGIAPRA